MKKYILSIVIISLLNGIVYGQSVNGKTAREVLENMNKKCLEIQNGKYTLERKFKFLSGLDTTFREGTVIYERFPEDSLFGFKMWLESKTDSFSRYYDGKYIYTLSQGKKFVTIDTTQEDNYSAIKGSYVGSFIAFPLITTKPINAITDSTADITFDPSTNKDTSVILIKYPDGRMEGKLNNCWARWFIDTKSDLPVAKEEHMVYDEEVQYEYFRVLSLSVNSKEHSEWINGPKWGENYDTFYKQPYVETKPLKNDTTAPGWAALDFNGDSIYYPGIEAKLFMVDFWYRGCHPCVMAMPFLQKMHENYSAKGLKVIGLNPSDYKIKDTEQFKAFLKRRNVSYTMAFITHDVTKNYKVQGYPTLYLIDKAGKVIHSQIGYGEEVDAEIEKIIKEYLEKN